MNDSIMVDECNANEEYPRCNGSESPFEMDGWQVLRGQSMRRGDLVWNQNSHDWTHIGERAWGHIASDFFSMPVIRRGTPRFSRCEDKTMDSKTDVAEHSAATDGSTTEDAIVFGERQWVYCNQHLRPHLTGWCTVDVSNKVGLGVTDEHEAKLKCEAWGFKLYKG